MKSLISHLGLAIGNVRCVRRFSWTLHFVVYVHFQTNCSRDWFQIWWIHILWLSTSLIHFWSCCTAFSSFPGIWLVEQFPRICGQTTDQIRFKFGGPTHYGPPQTWLTFGHASLNFCHFLASNWLSSFHTFADKQLIKLDSNLVLPAHYKPHPAWLAFGKCSTEFPLFPGLLLVKQFLCICKQTVDQIEVKFGVTTHLGLPLAWLTLGYFVLNPCFDYPSLWFNPPAEDLHPLVPCLLQCRCKTCMVHQTFVWWALYIPYKFVKSSIRHFGLAIGNVRCFRRFLPTLLLCEIWQWNCCMLFVHRCSQLWEPGIHYNVANLLKICFKSKS